MERIGQFGLLDVARTVRLRLKHAEDHTVCDSFPLPNSHSGRDELRLRSPPCGKATPPLSPSPTKLLTNIQSPTVSPPNADFQRHSIRRPRPHNHSLSNAPRPTDFLRPYILHLQTFRTPPRALSQNGHLRRRDRVRLPVLKRPVKLACIQLASGADKAVNLANARAKVLEAARDGAKIVVLPECFNSPYGCDYFPKYAETLLPSPPTREQSPSFHALAAMASESGAYLVGGSIPELDGETGKFYNTSLVFSPRGELLATHRKVHLFDIDIPGKITFRESEVLSPATR
ncbi:nitrilase family protein [Colletotrichum tofieldiae]|nr:nitrilase family protein [Colletotrichum tofieldiae]